MGDTMIEATLWTEDSANPAKARLMYDVSGTWTLVPGAPTLATVETAADRVRSNTFSLPAGDNEYRFEKNHIAGTIHHIESADIIMSVP